ncbi:aminotransferase class V-fold PLP-dependent enzyme, partial [Megasphaera sp. DJF_B143]|uniref:aminotransferase class V-fold PLP-dependent enzyme n=1 Tax=Megasphaera sp. DJF_B143 TaxID=537288 RepID=UPI0035169C17
MLQMPAAPRFCIKKRGRQTNRFNSLRTAVSSSNIKHQTSNYLSRRCTMYYFDNAATTVQKPPAVAEAVYEVLHSGLYGNPSRGAHGYSLRAYELVLEAKEQVKG